MSETKLSNPKDAIGITKPSLSVLPLGALQQAGLHIGRTHPRIFYAIALGMLEGACKYGRHNYRVVGVRASIYYDAFMRHMSDYRQEELYDPDSTLPHLLKAASSLVVVIDADMGSEHVDDRPPECIYEMFFPYADLTAEDLLSRWWDGSFSTPARALEKVCAMFHDDVVEGKYPEWTNDNWWDEVKRQTTAILARYPNPVKAYTQAEHPL